MNKLEEFKAKIANDEIDPEDYRCFQISGGRDCPYCLVDCGDSYHFKNCPIGEALGEALR